MLTTRGRFAQGTPNGAAISVATIPGATTPSTFAYEAGVAMPGLTAPARRVALFLSDTTAGNWNTNGIALFDATVTWAAGVAVGGTSDGQSDDTTAAAEGPGLRRPPSSQRLRWSWWPSSRKVTAFAAVGARSRAGLTGLIGSSGVGRRIDRQAATLTVHEMPADIERIVAAIRKKAQDFGGRGLGPERGNGPPDRPRGRRRDLTDDVAAGDPLGVVGTGRGSRSSSRRARRRASGSSAVSHRGSDGSASVAAGGHALRLGWDRSLRLSVVRGRGSLRWLRCLPIGPGRPPRSARDGGVRLGPGVASRQARTRARS